MKTRQISIRTPDGVSLDATIVEADRSGAPFVILAHGITVDKEEEGAFENLSDALASEGYGSLRFSFRGHGASGLDSAALTVSGEMIDLKTIVDYVLPKEGKLGGLVAASFGAVSTSLLARYLEPRVNCLTLWNPVLSLEETFVKPSTEWAKKNFSGSNVASIYNDGVFKIDGEFSVGVVFWEELHHFRPDRTLTQTKTPLLILHGDRDTYAPFGVSKRFVAERPKSRLIVVHGSDHGFPTPKAEQFAIEETVRFVAEHN